MQLRVSVPSRRHHAWRPRWLPGCHRGDVGVEACKQV